MTDYAFGHGNDELQRLQHQARVLEPLSLRLFGEMGLKPGMRVLDLGCGAGDLTMLAARQVGRRGSVEGVDESPEAVLLAAQRATQAKLKNIRFHTSTIDAFSTQAPYDAVIGRYILLHQYDPVAFLRTMSTLAEQLRREALQANAQLLGPLQVGAWARTASRV